MPTFLFPQTPRFFRITKNVIKLLSQTHTIFENYDFVYKRILKMQFIKLN